MTGPNRYLFFDVSETLKAHYVSGIQRVVIEWVKVFGFVANENKLILRLVYFDDQFSVFRSMSEDRFLELVNSRSKLTVGQDSKKIRVITFLRPLLRLVLPIYVLNYLRYKHFKKYFPQIDSNGQVIIDEVVSFSHEDLFFFADSFWNNPREIQYIQKHVSPSNRIFFIHDLLPLTHPDFFEKKSIKLFKNLLPLIDSSKLVLCSTEYVKNDLIKFQANANCFEVIQFGSKHIDSFNNSEPVTWDSGKPIRVISVGTIEPRKNYETIMKWLDETELNIDLRIIGRRGWKSTKIIKLFKKNFGSCSRNVKFEWFPSVSDSELRNHFEWANVGICASIAEGYGLPLREFLERGLPVAASSIPPFKEIKDQYQVRYFDPLDTSQLDLAVRSASEILNPHKVKGVSWEESAAEIAKLIKHIYKSC